MVWLHWTETEACTKVPEVLKAGEDQSCLRSIRLLGKVGTVLLDTVVQLFSFLGLLPLIVSPLSGTGPAAPSRT